MRPTVFANVTPDMTIAREEILGPVLSIIGFKDEEDAVRIANDTPYGLAGYVSSGDPERARRVSRPVHRQRKKARRGAQICRRAFVEKQRRVLRQRIGIFALGQEPDNRERIAQNTHPAFGGLAPIAQRGGRPVAFANRGKNFQLQGPSKTAVSSLRRITSKNSSGEGGVTRGVADMSITPPAEFFHK